MLSSNWNPVFKLQCWDSFTFVRKRLWSWWDGFWGHSYWTGQRHFSWLLLDTALPQKHCTSCLAYTHGQVENSFLFGFWTETSWNHSIDDAVINLELVSMCNTGMILPWNETGFRAWGKATKRQQQALGFDARDKSRISIINKIPKSWWDGYWGHSYWMRPWNFSWLLLDPALPQKHCPSCLAYSHVQVENSYLFGSRAETSWNHLEKAVINLEPIFKLQCCADFTLVGSRLWSSGQSSRAPAASSWFRRKRQE